MCTVTFEKSPKEAESDMSIYKLMYKTDDKSKWRSPFFNHIYEKGKEYKESMDPIERREEVALFDERDEEHFENSYTNTDRLWEGKTRGEVEIIGKGFHAATSRRRLIDVWRNSPPYAAVVAGIIPEGSHYYANPTGLIVSDAIILQEEVEMP